MKNVFTPVFLVTLLLLYGVHYLGVGADTGAAVIPFFAVVTFVIALCCCILKKFTWSYLFIVLAVGLLIAGQFLKEKSAFNGVVRFSLDIPPNEYVTLHGTLAAFPEIGPEFSTLHLEVNSLEYLREKILERFTIRVKVKGDLRHFFRGDRIVISARVYPGRFNRNFYPSGMEDYVLSRETHFNGYCKSSHMVEVEGGAGFGWRLIGKWRNGIRGVIEGTYSRVEGELDPGGVFLEAILLGERARLGKGERERLLDAGVYHLLAISGAHIGMIALFSLLFLRFLKVSARKRYIITALLLVLFLVLSGFKVSAERAVLMALLIFTARFFYLEVDIFNIISFAGLLILIGNPAQFLDAGFILTFTLTSAIVIGRKIFLLSNEDTTKQKFLEVQEPFFKKVPGRRRHLYELLSASFSASLIALPLSLFFFKRYSFAGFFAGLVLMPLTAIITGMGILLIPLAPLFPGAARLVLVVLDPLLWFFFRVVEFFSSGADIFTIYRASPPVLLVVGVLVAFWALSITRTKVRKVIFGFILLVGISYMSADLFYYRPGNLEVFYLDVGQGDSQVVVLPGGDAILIDAGGSYYSDFQVGKTVVLPFLLQEGIKVKWVAVSHFHPDHVNGIAEIIHILKPEALWISAENEGGASYDRLMRVLPGSVRVERLHAPVVKRIGECRIEFLHPDEWISGVRPRNDHSQVIKVSDSYRSFLFPGDIERGVERELVERMCSRLRAVVLKVPHHGSRTSSTVEFLKCVSPEWAIFSYAWNNRFNFPHRGVIRTYKSLGIKYLSTVHSGGIRIVSLPDSIKIETSR